jgi:site-specific DNA-methyltransferase (adenine-specific)
LAKPIRSESALLARGRDSYRRQSAEVEKLLAELGAVSVQRNRGIDGFLRSPRGLLPLRIQRPSEGQDAALEALLSATDDKDYPARLLIMRCPT